MHQWRKCFCPVNRHKPLRLQRWAKRQLSPSVVNFQAKVRFDGPTSAVEECVGSARNIVQLLRLEDKIGVSGGAGVGVGVGIPGVSELESAARTLSVALLPIAQSWLSVEYSVPDVVSTAVVTSPGMMYKFPYATMADSLGANASIGSVQMVCPCMRSSMQIGRPVLDHCMPRVGLLLHRFCRPQLWAFLAR